MKRNSILMVLVFLLLSGTAVHAQNTKTDIKKDLDKHNEQADKITGKKIEQQVISGKKVETLTPPATTAIAKSKPVKSVIKKKRKSAHTKKRL